MARPSLVALALAALLATPALAQPLEQRLARVETRLAAEEAALEALSARASALDDEAHRLAERAVALARRVQEREAALAAVEGRIARLAREEAAAAAALEGRQAAVEATLAGLYRLARGGAEPVLALSAPSLLRAARARRVLAAALPALETDARRLAGDLAELARLRGRLAEQREAALAERAAWRAEATRLDALLAERRAAAQAAAEERDAARRSLEALAAQARDLGDLVARLERAAPAPPRLKPGTQGLPLASITAARGSLPPPVTGRLVGRFGEPTEDGPARGIRIEAPGGARVVTPFDGRVAFAGAFRGLGRILIIEHAEGYHTLLAGLSRIDCQQGQWLLAGEPVGVMASTSSANPVLYVELRRDGEPINPLPWLAAMDRKVNG